LHKEHVQKKYDSILDCCRSHADLSEALEQCLYFQQGHWWIYYQSVLRHVPVSFNDKVVLDFGCKYGLASPLFFEMGAKQFYGVDIYDRMLEIGKQLLEEYGDTVRFIKNSAGYIPLQPESVDIVILNEVISHIHPTQLDTIYEEIARILKIDGVLFISDGNNLRHPGYFKNTLVPLYDAFENGPDGEATTPEGVLITQSFLSTRKQMIRVLCPDLDAEKVEYLAKNTAGLFGNFFHQTVDQFVQTGELICRPYRRGMWPVSPGSGAIEERGFYHEQVEMTLNNYGFLTRRVFLDKPDIKIFNLVGFLKDLFDFFRILIGRIREPDNLYKQPYVIPHIRLIRFYFLHLFRPNWTLKLPGFQIIAIKKY
jgi:SAM-dependent methyltransferase